MYVKLLIIELGPLAWHTFTVVAVGSVRASQGPPTVVHGGRGGVRGSLQRTVIRVVLVKHVTDVTEEPRGRQLVIIILFPTVPVNV